MEEIRKMIESAEENGLAVPDNAEEVLLRAFEKLEQKRIEPDRKTLYAELEAHGPTDVRDFLISVDDSNIVKPFFTKCLHSEFLRIRRNLMESQLKSFDFRLDVWDIFYPNRGIPCRTHFDFSRIKSPQLKNELKYLLAEETKQSFLTPGNSNDFRLRSVVELLSEYAEELNVNCFRDLTERKLGHIFLDLEVKKKLNPQTIALKKSCFSFCFKLLMQSDRTDKPEENYARNIRLHHSAEQITPTDVIPDNVLAQIFEHLDETPVHVQLIFRLFLESGWRSGEILKLKTSDIEPSERSPGRGVLRSTVYKTREARKKRGLDEFNTCLISEGLYSDLSDYISKTNKDRTELKTDLVFFCDSYKGPVPYLGHKQISVWINKICRKYNITDANGNVWHFTIRQTRKTTLSMLINDGATLSEVQNQAGHLKDETTVNYYAQIKSSRLSNLNAEFFTERFDMFCEDKQLDEYSEEERLLLFADFCTSKREVEMGICMKHPKEGTCETLGQTDCATCPKLCTGKKYRDKWQRLKDDSGRRLEEYKKRYESAGFSEDEYKSFREFSQEARLFESYSAVLERIDND